MNQLNKNGEKCFCESALGYAACCGRFIDDREIPQTAEQLMRSRYTAYARLNVGYLLTSWHSSTRPATLELDREANWIGLKIVRAVQGQPGDDNGIIEFIARYKLRNL